ncbi:hypothetical protein [Psychrosphaera aestuarii]|uniref:hypothetical protein n=1 Tax=Psychrosphaera aestuarii TaxID=1266052 RepID=UPI001B323646|nr:hypothetical protein [Psychrosphaera aestuarii]
MDVSPHIRKFVAITQQTLHHVPSLSRKYATRAIEKVSIVNTKLVRTFSKLKSFWTSLTFAQICYLISFVLLFVMIFPEGIELAHLTLPVVIILIGLTNEFWPHFLKVWDSLQGKAFILTFYAIMANTALASASGLVNEVTHVSADSLTYSHNMALIINIPTWFILSSFLMLLVIQILLPIYLILLILLKPFGIHKIWHKPDYRFPIVTAFIRYLLATFLLLFFLFGSIQSGFLNQNSPLLGSVFVGFISSDEKANSLTLETNKGLEAHKGSEANEGSEVNEDSKDAALHITNVEEHAFSRDTLLRKSNNVHLVQKQILAAFIYNYEADSFSRCAHPENTRVIELNDYEILIVKKSETADIHYEFSVIACNSPGITPGKNIVFTE